VVERLVQSPAAAAVGTGSLPRGLEPSSGELLGPR